MRPRLLPILIAAALPLALTAQPKPPAADCEVPPDAPMALVTGSKPADLQKPNAPAAKFTVPAGQAVLTGRHDGEWTCASHYGTGNGWMLTNRLQPIQPDLHPPVTAWTGTWTLLGVKKQPHDAETKLLISNGAAPATLKVDGQAYWFGRVVNGERVVHEGTVSGDALPEGNRLHIADGGCEVDLSLIGAFLNVRDNRECGGMNVTFTGVWQKIR